MCGCLVAVRYYLSQGLVQACEIELKQRKSRSGVHEKKELVCTYTRQKKKRRYV